MSSTSHHHASPITTPAAPAPAPAARQPLRWSYPLAAASGQTAAGPQTYFQALSQADGGFYPLGANGLWHGGIHLGAGPGGLLTPDSPLLSIADGEVVAYRLDTRYPEVDYPDSRKALYSTGFVLVRHTMVLPNTSGSSMPASADETLEFYSLYMHLLDWAGYQTAEKDRDEDVASPTAPIRRMPFWKGNRRFCVGNRCTDRQRPEQVCRPTRIDPLGDFIASDFKTAVPEPEPQLTGIHIRDGEKGDIIGLLPRGSEVAIAGTAIKGWARITQFIKGGPVGWTVGNTAPRLATEYGWVYLDELDLMIDPDPLDEVVVLDTPFPVKAGEVVGYPGHYLRHRDSNPLPAKPTRPLVHLEVFAGDGFAAFVEKSRQRAAVLPDSQKTMLTVSVGAKLVAPSEPDQTIAAGLRLRPASGKPQTGRWAKVQPVRLTLAPAAHGQGRGQAHQAPEQPVETSCGGPAWVERSLSGQTTSEVVKGWKSFPLQLANATASAAAFEEVFSDAELSKLETAHDDNGVQWWQITVGTGEGDTTTGWVCTKKHPQTQWQSPWAWPGFEAVDHTSVSVTDAYKRDVCVRDQLLEGEEEEFRLSASSVNGSPLITKLEKAVDHLGNGDGTVTANELAQAYGTSWLAKALSHLIVRYESEWGGDMSKWEALSDLMKADKSLWQVELQRIEKLQWWDKVKAVKGFPASPIVYHFHPIGLAGNFIGNCNCINVSAFLQAYEAEHTSFEAGTPPLDSTSKYNLRILIQGILDSYRKFENSECKIPYIAYMLGTARLETKKYHEDKNKFIYFEPTSESGLVRYFDKYDPVLAETERLRRRAENNGNTAQGDGFKYRGRGYVQVTWKNTYRAVGNKVGVDLVNNPIRMEEPAIAAWAMVYGMEVGLFTGKKLSDYVSDTRQDYLNARQIINGHDQADAIADFATRLKSILESSKC